MLLSILHTQDNHHNQESSAPDGDGAKAEEPCSLPYKVMYFKIPHQCTKEGSRPSSGNILRSVNMSFCLQILFLSSPLIFRDTKGVFHFQESSQRTAWSLQCLKRRREKSLKGCWEWMLTVQSLSGEENGLPHTQRPSLALETMHSGSFLHFGKQSQVIKSRRHCHVSLYQCRNAALLVKTQEVTLPSSLCPHNPSTLPWKAFVQAWLYL